jgi:hypothetical protein
MSILAENLRLKDNLIDIINGEVTLTIEFDTMMLELKNVLIMGSANFSVIINY